MEIYTLVVQYTLLGAASIVMFATVFFIFAAPPLPKPPPRIRALLPARTATTDTNVL